MLRLERDLEESKLFSYVERVHDPKFTMTIRLAKKSGQRGRSMTFFENLETRICPIGLEKLVHIFSNNWCGYLLPLLAQFFFIIISATSKWEQRIATVNETRA